MKKLIVTLFLNLQAFSFAAEIQPITISTIHGETVVDDPLIIELIESQLIQRLKEIHQYGVDQYVRPPWKYPYTRYEHSLGVFQIVKRHGGSRQEQVAALLHDASHTVFSHTLDMLFMKRMDGESYQDMNHKAFLSQFGAVPILDRYIFCVEDILPDRLEFRRLEQPSPRLCGDRIEYIIHHGDLAGLLTKEDIQQIHEHLHFSEGEWFFDTVESAEKFARISLKSTLEVWGGPQAYLVPRLISKAIGLLLDEGKIEVDDLHFNIRDADMWALLNESSHPEVQRLVNYAKTIDDHFTLTDDSPETDSTIEVLKTKFRGVDPFVKREGGLKTLTSLSLSYKRDYDEAKNQIQKGWWVRYR